jgi:transposase InsO family protein
LIAQVNGLYAIPAQTEESAHVAKLTINELHHALGHVAQGAVQYAVKQGLIEGVKLNSTSTPEFCEACTKAKATCQPFLEETVNRAHTYGELVHMDLWGPTQTESVAGHLYYISFTNDFSQETKVRFLKLKSEALSTLKDYETELKCQTPGAKIKKLRSDRGGEYLSTEFDRYLKDQGIKRQPTIHHLPQQNGVAERLNRTLVEHAQAMLLGRDMPKILWAEALNYATWLKNRLPSHATPDKTPYELVNKSKPNLALAHEFGTLVYVHITTGGKLEAKAEEATFVGVDQESKGYRIWWAAKQKVFIEQNVTFPPMGPVTVRLIDNPDVGELGIIDTLTVPAVPETPQSDVQPIKQPPPPMPTTPPRSNIPLPDRSR